MPNDAWMVMSQRRNDGCVRSVVDASEEVLATAECQAWRAQEIQW